MCKATNLATSFPPCPSNTPNKLVSFPMSNAHKCASSYTTLLKTAWTKYFSPYLSSIPALQLQHTSTLHSLQNQSPKPHRSPLHTSPASHLFSDRFTQICSHCTRKKFTKRQILDATKSESVALACLQTRPIVAAFVSMAQIVIPSRLVRVVPRPVASLRRRGRCVLCRHVPRAIGIGSSRRRVWKIAATREEGATPLEVVQKENELLKAELETEDAAEGLPETPEDYWSPAVQGCTKLP